MIGKTLGHYLVGEQLGRGGMGEVYLADDLNLNRKVALKFLPDAFTGDPERMARFEREAKLLASLNHPNIAAIYGLEQAEGKRFLVLELVEGQTLAQRISKGPLPVEEALGVCRQIAEGLEAAHEKGVIHRDLKPANVMITTGDKVKILDFGLAKALSDEAQSVDSSQSPTITEAMTQPGVILGTAAYMSPEQAKGKSVDKRADIWAFGCILYECLTGKRVFEGETVTETLAAVLTRDPELEKVPAKMHPLLYRCLEKDPRKRLRDIGDAYPLLEGAPEAVPAKRPWLAWSVAAVLAIVAAIALWSLWHAAQPSAQPLVRLDVDLGPGVSLGSQYGTDVIISPDGNRLVFVSNSRLFTRHFDQPRAVELAGTEGAFEPFFSPDSQRVAFFAGGKLKSLSVEGGAVIALCDARGPLGGSWGQDGNIIAALASGRALSQIPSAGGTPTPVTELAQQEVTHCWPQILLGGGAVLFTAVTSIGANIEVMSLKDHRRKTLLKGGMYGRYLPSGHLVYINDRTLFAIPFDLDNLEVLGTPTPVLEGVSTSNIGYAQFDFSQGGTLVYRSSGGVSGLVTLQWLDGTGKTQPLPAEPGLFGQPHLSPDGKLLVLTILSESGSDIWTYDWQRDTMTRLTFGGGGFSHPVWSSDDRHVAFHSPKGGIFWTQADGTGKPQPLVQSNNQQYPGSFSPDGKRLAFTETNPQSGWDLWTVSVENQGGQLQAGKPEVFLKTPFIEVMPVFSPNGRWIAYMSDETGTEEIYVRAFPDRGGKWMISNGGGMMALWSQNGRELFYRTADQRIMVVTYTVRGDSFVADKPRLWTEKRLADTSIYQNLDITPDGKRFMVLLPAEVAGEQQVQNHVTFLLNFFDELRRRVPTGSK
jgi:Tol biopolymer transport system component